MLIWRGVSTQKRESGVIKASIEDVPVPPVCVRFLAAWWSSAPCRQTPPHPGHQTWRRRNPHGNRCQTLACPPGAHRKHMHDFLHSPMKKVIKWHARSHTHTSNYAVKHSATEDDEIVWSKLHFLQVIYFTTGINFSSSNLHHSTSSIASNFPRALGITFKSVWWQCWWRLHATVGTSGQQAKEVKTKKTLTSS